MERISLLGFDRVLKNKCVLILNSKFSHSVISGEKIP